MVSVDIPYLGRVQAANVEALSAEVRRRIIAEDYGASDIGSGWTIRDRYGRKLGQLCYNGRIVHTSDPPPRVIKSR